MQSCLSASGPEPGHADRYRAAADESTAPSLFLNRSASAARSFRLVLLFRKLGAHCLVIREQSRYSSKSMLRSGQPDCLFYLCKRILLSGLCASGLFLTSCTSNPPSPAPRSSMSPGRHHGTDERQALQPGSFPNSRLTPGATLEVTKEDVCTAGYTKKVRNVPVSVKRQVYAEYDTEYVRGAYEVDHLIPLELGGSNSIRNLWPEPYDLVWGAHVKDQLENRLHGLVCRESLPLETAQNWIAHDWIGAYRRVFHTKVPRIRRDYREGSHRRGE